MRVLRLIGKIALSRSTTHLDVHKNEIFEFVLLEQGKNLRSPLRESFFDGGGVEMAE